LAPETGIVIAAALVVLTGLVLVLVNLIHHLGAPQALPVTAECIDKLCIDATNLLRLLDEERLYGFQTQRMATKLRIQRCRLLREHLRHLEDDFKLVCIALKVIIVQSKQDRPDLAWALLRNQITFTYRMKVVRFRLLCIRFGLVRGWSV
jgi:hypothetical protein